MPKIPIDLSAGIAGDSISAVSNMPTAGMFPQTDSRTGKTVIKSPCSTSSDSSIRTGNYVFGGIVAPAQTITPLSTTESVFSVVDQGGANTYEIYENTTLKASAAFSLGTADPFDGDCRLATNGINIVGVWSGKNNVSADDFVYDIATGVLTSLPTADANYAGFGKAIDVTYQDGRYFFVTDSAIFHGDLKTDAGQGVAFNALSFATSPFADQAIRGIEPLNGSLYVMSAKESTTYQNVGTTPFTLQHNTSVSISAGAIKGSSKIMAFGKIYTISSTTEGDSGMYVISGYDTQRLDNGEIVNYLRPQGGSLLRYHATAYTYGKSNFVQMVYPTTGLGSNVIVYDELSGKLHYRGARRTSDGVLQTTWPFRFFFKKEYSGLQALGLDYSGTQTIKLFTVDEDNGNIAKYLFSYQEQNNVYYFNYLRNSAEPFSIKKVRMSFANIATAELSISVDGESFTSLGEFDLSAKQNAQKVCEWRRINRQLSQAMFKVEVTPDDSEGVMAIIDGLIEV